jgi:hypothetical protein
MNNSTNPEPDHNATQPSDPKPTPGPKPIEEPAPDALPGEAPLPNPDEVRVPPKIL